MSKVLRMAAMLRELLSRILRIDDVEGVSLRFGLTHRQSDVLAQLLFGLSEKEISVQLGLSQHTVHQHVKVIYKIAMVRSASSVQVMYRVGEATVSRVPSVLASVIVPRCHSVSRDRPSAPAVAQWLQPVGLGGVSGIGPPIYAVLSAIAVGIICSCIRWLLIDHVLHA